MKPNDDDYLDEEVEVDFMDCPECGDSTSEFVLAENGGICDECLGDDLDDDYWDLYENEFDLDWEDEDDDYPL